jgi:hypothetical protein
MGGRQSGEGGARGMSVVISLNLVLTTAAGDQPNNNNPLIGWHNLVTVANIVADSEQAGFPAIELANALTHRMWRSDSQAVQHVTVTHNAVDPVDYVAIAGHNFGTAQIAVRIDGYNQLVMGNPDWFTLVQEFMPAHNGPLLFRFVPQSLLGVRVRMASGAAAPIAAVVYVGRLLVLQRRIYVGHKPLLFNERTEAFAGRAERGQYLGSLILGAWNDGTLQQNNVTASFYREQIEPWRRAGLMARRPFFFAWRPGDYADECAYCWPMGDLDVGNQLANGMMQFALNMQGIVS